MPRAVGGTAKFTQNLLAHNKAQVWIGPPATGNFETVATYYKPGSQIPPPLSVDGDDEGVTISEEIKENSVSDN